MFGHNLRNVDDILAHLPDEIPVLPLRNTVAFPFNVLPIVVGTPGSLQLAQDTLEGDKLLMLVAMREPDIEGPKRTDVYEVGSIATIVRAVPLHNGAIQLFVQTLERVRISEWTAENPYLKARIRLAPDIEEDDTESDALNRNLVNISREIIEMMPNVPNELADALQQLDNNRVLTYTVASNSRLTNEQQIQILDEDSLNAKMRLLLDALAHEKQVLQVGQEIRDQAQEAVNKEQREYYLRRQLERIKGELGEANDDAAEVEEYRHKIETLDLSDEARQQAYGELKRMERLSPQTAEYGVIRTYLEWLLDLPWGVYSEDNLDITNARAVLDADHYNLSDVKDRIIEHLAIRKLAVERKEELEAEISEEDRAANAILLFVGPPGVGKTSLGKSIARALGRQFTRMSLGGMRDESEIRGHRRTYIGAMPGRIIQAIKRTGTSNPVVMLDEIDKVGQDWRGDPASALLEVLDPQQNHAFRDHYLDIDFDLSKVFFIATANVLDTIAPALRDRMEIIRLDGYTEYDKIRIAQEHLIGRQMKANSLREGEVTFTEDALRRIIREYTHEAGVRTLERQIGSVMRKVAISIASGEAENVEITPELVRQYLGKPLRRFEPSERDEVPGVATGLAWTPFGGDVLFVEAAKTPGQGRLTITGQLGKVMEESIHIAYSYLYAHADELNIMPSMFKNFDFHVHVPEGAVPKDGPSAGITMTTALYSLLSGKGASAKVAMTGEMTLRGQVLPVGGIKMKALAAHRGGIRTVIIPKKNIDDLDELPEDIREEMEFIPVGRIDEVLDIAVRDVRKTEEMPSAA